MKNSVIEKSLITFIKNNSICPGLYWVPLTRLKSEIPVIAYDVDAIYKGNDIDLLRKIVDYESYIPELIKTLDLLNHTAFLDNGWSDYYIVSKKYKWIIGFNHHDIISCIGEGLDLGCFENQ